MNIFYSAQSKYLKRNCIGSDIFLKYVKNYFQKTINTKTKRTIKVNNVFFITHVFIFISTYVWSIRLLQTLDNVRQIMKDNVCNVDNIGKTAYSRKMFPVINYPNLFTMLLMSWQTREWHTFITELFPLRHLGALLIHVMWRITIFFSSFVSR